MQISYHLASHDIFVRPSVLDAVHRCFSIITPTGVIQLTMNPTVFDMLVSLIKAEVKDRYPNKLENKWISYTSRQHDASLRVVDVRLVDLWSRRSSAYVDLRLYSGKKRKHCLQLTVSFSQLAQMYQVLSECSHDQNTANQPAENVV